MLRNQFQTKIKTTPDTYTHCKHKLEEEGKIVNGLLEWFIFSVFLNFVTGQCLFNVPDVTLFP